LYLARGLGVGVAVGRGVPGGFSVERADDIAVDRPGDGVRLPVDLVVVEILVDIGLVVDGLAIVV
jgi:hypothetical protein